MTDSKQVSPEEREAIQADKGIEATGQETVIVLRTVRLSGGC